MEGVKKFLFEWGLYFVIVALSFAIVVALNVAVVILFLIISFSSSNESVQAVFLVCGSILILSVNLALCFLCFEQPDESNLGESGSAYNIQAFGIGLVASSIMSKVLHSNRNPIGGLVTLAILFAFVSPVISSFGIASHIMIWMKKQSTVPVKTSNEILDVQLPEKKKRTKKSRHAD